MPPLWNDSRRPRASCGPASAVRRDQRHYAAGHLRNVITIATALNLTKRLAKGESLGGRNSTATLRRWDRSTATRR
jgi:hypothetical protein